MENDELAPGIMARATGAGDGVLWVHGYTIHSGLWLELWERLPGWRHIGVDLPGHGGSRPLARGEDLYALGLLLADAAIQRGVRHVVGLSLGSLIALQVVLARPRAFQSLVVGAPTIGGGPSEALVAARYRQLRALHARLGGGPWMTSLWMTSPPDIFRGGEARPALWRRLAEAIDAHSWDELHGDSGIDRLTQDEQPLEQVAAIEARTLILIGERELPAFRESAEILRRHIPGSRVAELSAVGHLCMLESPADSATLIAHHLAGGADVR